MPLKTDPDSLGFLLNETARLMRHDFERRIAGIGLQVTTGEARALIYVAANDGARQSVIAERMGVEPMTVCGYLDRLEKCGLVSRHPDPGDRRAKNVRTTDAADATIAAIRAEGKAMVEQAQAGLDAESRAILAAALRTVRGNLIEMLDERNPARLAVAGDGVPA
ncbi:MAG: MarR family winged helix-turn-helix transcriptional regulator [Rhizobium sp.]|nr:MarR family winged helix-turn-helix transcriptional regulator [Rhizobium sp.]